MSRRILLILIALALAAPASADQFTYFKKKGAAGGGACAESAVVCTTGYVGNNYAIGAADNSYYAGYRFDDYPSTMTVCGVDVLMTLGAGSIAGKTFTAKIWSVTGGNLNATLATSDNVTGSDAWNGTYVHFTFSTPQAVSAASVVAITVDMGGTDASNYAYAHYSNVDYGALGTGFTVQFNNTGAVVTYTGYGAGMKVWAQ